MGDVSSADISLVPNFTVIDDTEHWHTIRGYLATPANYLLAIDNLMDLTHPEYLHDKSLGSPPLKSAHYKVYEEGPRVVHSNRWFDTGPIPPVMERSFPTAGRPVEHWVNMRWEAASSLWLHNGVTFPGRPREEGMNAYSAHLLTPQTASSAHYLFTFTRAAAEARAQDNDEEMRALSRLC